MTVVRMSVAGLMFLAIAVVLALASVPFEALAVPLGAGVGLAFCAAHEAIIGRSAFSR